MWVGLVQSGEGFKSQDWDFPKKESLRQQQRYSAWVSACRAQPSWWLINTFIIAQEKAARQQLPYESSFVEFLAHTEIRQCTGLLHCTFHVVVPRVLTVLSDLPKAVSLLRHINSDFSDSCGLPMGTRGKGGSPTAPLSYQPCRKDSAFLLGPLTSWPWSWSPRHTPDRGSSSRQGRNVTQWLVTAPKPGEPVSRQGCIPRMSVRFRGKSWINTSQTVRKKLISDVVQKLVSVLIFL